MAEREDPDAPIGDEGSGTDAGPPAGAPDGGWSFAAQAHYDPTEFRDLTTVIVGAIAEAEGVPITEVLSPPLYAVVDVAALEDALFGRPAVQPNGTESSVEFRYNEYKVGVEADGWVTVSKPADETVAD